MKKKQYLCGQIIIIFMLSLKRIFTDYEHFDEGPLPYGMAFATSLQWLYRDEQFETADFRDHNYCMKRCLPLYDFMSLVTAFICDSFGKFGEEKLNEYMIAMEAGKKEFRLDEIRPFYQYKDDNISISKMESWTTEVVLWASYIYCLLRSELKQDKKGQFTTSKDLFLRLLQHKSCLNEKAFRKHFLMRHVNVTMQTFIMNLPTSGSVAETTIQEQDQASVQKQMEELQNVVVQQRDEISKIKAELAEYKERNRGGLSPHMTALLGLKLAPLLDVDYSNKKQLAPVLSALFGWGKRSLERQLCSYFSNEEEQNLADIFGTLSPPLAKKICPGWEPHSPSDGEAPIEK